MSVLRMGDYRTSRPIVKLYPLEVFNASDEEASGEPNQQESDPVPNRVITLEEGCHKGTTSNI